MSEGRRASVIDGALFVVMASVVVLVTRGYVGAERCFYSWDHASYQTMAVETAEAFRSSPLTGWHALRQSFHADYNALFALPLVPWILLFGPSRMSFELGVALAYLLPLPLAIGAVATRLMPEKRRVAFWAAAWLAILTPMTWVPALRGFPDSGGAALLTLALFSYLGDPDLGRRAAPLWLGGLLGAAVLFRRPFAYAVVAFFVSALLHALARAIARPGGGAAAWRLRRLGLVWVRLSLALSVAVSLLLVIAWSYVHRFVEYDFESLYRPYEVPVGTLLAWYAAPYGGLALLFSAAGLLLGLASRSVNRSAVAFLALFAALSAAQWTWRVRQVGEQYTLQFTPVVVLGLLAFCAIAIRGATRLRRSVVIGVVAGLSLLNLDLGLSTADVGMRSPLRPAFASRWAPLVRQDYGEVVRLVQELHHRGHADDAVYVAASSDTLNPEVIRQADRLLSGRLPGLLRVLDTPAVDSLGFFPLGELLDARFVVLAQPVQLHLAPESQRVVGAVYRAFLAHRAVAGDFEELPALYDLGECTGYIYERSRPTSRATAVATLEMMKADVPRRPGLQPDWAVVERAYPSWLTRNADGSARWVAHPAARSASARTTLVTVDPPPDRAQIAGAIAFVDRRCAGATLDFQVEGPDGETSTLAEVRRQPRDDGTFEVALETRGAPRLFLSLLDYSRSSSIDYCLLTVDPLVIRSAH
jgi:hypothetical protein